MNVGYALVALDQNQDLKMLLGEKASGNKVFREKGLRSSWERPELQRMLDQLRNSDTVIVLKLDRLARSTRDLPDMMELYAKLASFRSLPEPWANTPTSAFPRAVRGIVLCPYTV
jgi:DNA invertase Pin-like site-specific DNA recombinase